MESTAVMGGGGCRQVFAIARSKEPARLKGSFLDRLSADTARRTSRQTAAQGKKQRAEEEDAAALLGRFGGQGRVATSSTFEELQTSQGQGRSRRRDKKRDLAAQTLRAELEGMRLPALRKRAAKAGVSRTKLSEANESRDSQAAFVTLLMELQGHSPRPMSPRRPARRKVPGSGPDPEAKTDAIKLALRLQPQVPTGWALPGSDVGPEPPDRLAVQLVAEPEPELATGGSERATSPTSGRLEISATRPAGSEASYDGADDGSTSARSSASSAAASSASSATPPPTPRSPAEMVKDMIDLGIGGTEEDVRAALQAVLDCEGEPIEDVESKVHALVMYAKGKGWRELPGMVDEPEPLEDLAGVEQVKVEEVEELVQMGYSAEDAVRALAQAAPEKELAVGARVQGTFVEANEVIASAECGAPLPPADN
jgi:hypothetical protein